MRANDMANKKETNTSGGSGDDAGATGGSSG